MPRFEEIIAGLVAKAAGGEAGDYLSLLEPPPRPELGDYALACFPLSRKFKQDPKKIAADLATKLQLAGTPIGAVTPAGPYLNFRLDDRALAELVLTEIAAEGDRFGGSAAGQGRTVIVDYSSPNIAKPFHIGHLRSTVIGAALDRIYQARGFRVIGINHLGDWGTQFGMIMAAFVEDQNDQALAEHPIAYSLQLYVAYNKRAEKDPEARETAKAWFKRLEDGDPEATAMWKKFRELSLAEFERIYQRLGNRFDHYMGESFYNDKMDAGISAARAAGILTRGDDGAEMVDLEKFKMPPFLLKKSDGATLYATRELAAVLYRLSTFQPDLLLYVVGLPQELHFRQLKEVLRLMGREEAERIVHVKFGHVLGMSTRRGEVVLLEEVLDEAAAKAREKIEDNVAAGKLDPEIDRAELAEAVGIGALVANDLKHRRERDIHFDWDQALQFDGETGPYLQYAHARIRGILRKAGALPTAAVNFADLALPESRAVLRMLADFPAVIERAAKDYEPSLITTYLFDLAQAFNLFYLHHRVIGAGGETHPARLRLVAAAGQVMKNALRLLGIPVLEKM